MTNMANYVTLQALTLFLVFHLIGASDVSNSVSFRQEGRKLATGVGDTPWSVRGNRIIDNNGNEIYFSGINWNGFEGENCVAEGLSEADSALSLTAQVTKMKLLNFNLIRLPFAGPCMNDNTRKLNGLNYATNPTLLNKPAIEVMAAVVEAAGEQGIKVILDYHRVDKSNSSGAPEAGLWYTKEHPVNYFKDTWKKVAERFANMPNVVGVEIFNEPHYSEAVPPEFDGPSWTDNTTDENNFKNVVDEVAEIIKTVQPGWLICVQGMWDAAWWGSNLQFAARLPPNVTADKLVYTAHDYGPLVSANQSWLQPSDNFAFNVETYWNRTWAFVHDDGTAPVWIGEFGSKVPTDLSDPINALEDQWLTLFVDFIRRKKLVWTYFAWSPYSRDTGGIYLDDWIGTDGNKLRRIDSIFYPNYAIKPPTPPLPPPAPPVTIPPSPPFAPLAPFGLSLTASPPPSAQIFTSSIGGTTPSLMSFTSLRGHVFIAFVASVAIILYGQH